MNYFFAITSFFLIPFLTHAAPSSNRADILITTLPSQGKPAFEQGFRLESGQTIAWIGGSNFEYEDNYAWIESRLRAAHPKLKFKFRNLSWEGDTVFKRSRDHNHGSLMQQVSYVDADIVFLQFGQMEAFETEGSLGQFYQKYEELIRDIQKVTSKIVMISPMKIENLGLFNGPNFLGVNQKLHDINEKLKGMAAQYQAIYVDLFSKDFSTPMTSNGLHLLEAGHEKVSHEIMLQLNVPIIEPQWLSIMRKNIGLKNYTWREFYRPSNWAFAYGDRTQVTFSQGFDQVAQSFKPRLDWLESKIHEMHSLDTVKELSLPNKESFEHSKIDALSPAEEMAQLKIDDPNLNINLFASEKDGVINPVRMKWDKRGRLWVSCLPSYPQPDPGYGPSNYILICEDTDHDGRADSFKKFIDNIPMSFGFEFAENGIYVCEYSEIVFYEDKNGDDVPESRRVILSGFDSGDSHQNINSISWGHDGQLWVCQGHHATANTETLYGVKRMFGGGVFRFNPRTGRLDTFFGPSRAGANVWGTQTNVWGETLHITGAGKEVYDTSAGAIDYIDGPKNNATAFSTAKKCQFEILDSSHFPIELRGLYVFATFYTSEINVYKGELKNGAWESEQKNHFISSGPKVFRPVDINTGPAGELYILDWYNEIIGHYQASYKDPRRDKTHGRVWRMTFKDRALVPSIDYSKKSIAELFELMMSTEIHQRKIARAMLSGMSSDKVIPVLDRLYQSLKTEHDALKLSVLLGLYQAHEKVNIELLHQLLSHENSNARGVAVKAIARWNEQLTDPTELLITMAQDADPRVKIHAIVAATYLNSPQCLKIIMAAKSNHPVNAYASDLAMMATIRKWFPALSTLLKDIEPSKYEEIFNVAFKFDKEASLKVLQAQFLSNDETIRKNTLKLMIQHGDYQDAFKNSHSSDQAELLNFIEASMSFKKKLNSDQAERVTQQLLQQANTREAALIYAAYSGLSQYKQDCVKLLNSPATNEQVKIKLLGNLNSIFGDSDIAYLESFISKQNVELQAAAIELLTKIKLESGFSKLMELLESHSVQFNQRYLKYITENNSYANRLVSYVKVNGIKVEVIKNIHQAFQSLGYKNNAVMKGLEGLISNSQEDVFKHSDKTISELANETKEKGNLYRGKDIYHKAGMTCVVCHSILNHGGNLGPELSFVGRGLPMERVIESILWPSVEVKEGFELTSVKINDGNQIQGYIDSQTPNEVSIIVPATGEKKVINKNSISNIRKDGTLMPDNLLMALNHQEKLDLFAYVSSLGLEGVPQFYPDKAHEPKEGEGFIKIFNERDFEGWNGDQEWFKISDGVVVAGSLNQSIPTNKFLTYDKEVYNFEFHVDFKMIGDKVNGGVQFRSKRIPNHHEMIGYQADIIKKSNTGSIYDESRRKKVLNQRLVENENLIVNDDSWNHMVIHCKDNRLQTFINGWKTADHVETDLEIAALKGFFGLQVHSGPPVELHYKNVYLKEF